MALITIATGSAALLLPACSPSGGKGAKFGVTGVVYTDGSEDGASSINVQNIFPQKTGSPAQVYIALDGANFAGALSVRVVDRATGTAVLSGNVPAGTGAPGERIVGPIALPAGSEVSLDVVVTDTTTNWREELPFTRIFGNFPNGVPDTVLGMNTTDMAKYGTAYPK